MQAGRTQARTGNFDLNRFYQNLNRIQSSLGKPAPRPMSNSTTKNSRLRAAEDDRQKNLTNFKKELHNKGLIKGKIKIDQPYERVKIERVSSYEDGLNVSDTFKFSQHPSKNVEEDPYQKVRSKLLSWKTEEKMINARPENQYSRVTNTSNLLQQNKENIDSSMESTLENNQREAEKMTQTINSQLISELVKRNDVYCLVKRNVGDERDNSKKKAEDLSLAMQAHFRQHATMKRVIQKFKQLCGLNITDHQELLAFLKSGENQREFFQGQSSSGMMSD